MRSSRFLLFCLIFCAATVAACSGCPDEPGAYCDKTNGFNIIFPVDWAIDADPGNGRAVAARAPLEAGEDPEVKGTAFEVLVLRLQSNPDLDKFFDEHVKKLPVGKPYYQYEDSGEIKVGGRKTKYILYVTDTEPRYEARLEYFQKKGPNIYIFRGVTRGVQFNQFHDQFREIAYTFKLM